ncbi:extensin family protein [Salmonella enterica subsp. enterica]|nr:extensin family protein [Salmonella enterica subsp. enterica]
MALRSALFTHRQRAKQLTNVDGRLTASEHLGSYACVISHRADARRSEHASAEAALDVSGFQLSDGRKSHCSARLGRQETGATVLRYVKHSFQLPLITWAPEHRL